jgi:hypothetical protein
MSRLEQKKWLKHRAELEKLEQIIRSREGGSE